MPWNRIRFQYALVYAVIGAYMPYAPVYLHQLGLSDPQIGWTLGSIGLAVLFMPALMTHLADGHLTNRLLLCIGLSISCLTMGLMGFAAGFPVCVLITVLYAMGNTPTLSLLDGLAFSSIHHAERHHQKHIPPYHALRLWGSIGYLLPSLLLWPVFHYSHITTRIAPLAACFLAAIGAIWALSLPSPAKPARETAQQPPTLAALRALLQPQVFSVIGPTFVIFLSMYAIYNFLPRHVSNLGLSEEWLGPTMNIGVIVEIVCILISGRLFHLLGVRGIITLAGLCTVARHLVLATTDNLYAVIATQIAHGPLVVMLYLVLPMYLNIKSSPAYRNSMQGIYVMLCFGVARLIGSSIAGHIAQSSYRRMFAVSAAFAAAGTAWFLIAFREDEHTRNLRRKVGPTIERPVQEA